jgi:type II secretory pathway component PulC
LTEFKSIDLEKLEVEERERFYREFNTDKQAQELLVERNIFVSERVDPVGVPGLKGIILGKKSIAFFSNGMGLFIGESIGNYTVENIFEDRVVLSDSGKNQIILELWRD